MRDERLCHHAIGRTAAGIIAAVLLGAAMTGCTIWPGPGKYLKDNPFDQALATYWRQAVDVATERLLKRFPIGSPTTDLRRYLESIGSTCERKLGGPLVCRYSQFVLFRQLGIFGDEWREYNYHDFTTRVWPGQGPVARVIVCEFGVREVQRGPMIVGKRSYRRKSEFKPCGDDRTARQGAIGGDVDAR